MILDPSQNSCDKGGKAEGAYEQCTVCSKWRELEAGVKKWTGRAFRCSLVTWLPAFEGYSNKCDVPETVWG